MTTPFPPVEIMNNMYHIKVVATPNYVVFILSLWYMFASYRVLLNSVKMNAAPLHDNYILI